MTSINLFMLPYSSMDTNWSNIWNHSQVHPQQVGEMQSLYELMRNAGPGIPQGAPAPPIDLTVGESSNPHTQTSKGNGRAKTTPLKVKHSNFSIPEDNALCSAWLNVSLDPITG
jgi:hypothetical protein